MFLTFKNLKARLLSGNLKYLANLTVILSHCASGNLDNSESAITNLSLNNKKSYHQHNHFALIQFENQVFGKILELENS